MKKLIRRISLFAVIFVLFSGINFAINYYFIRTNIPRFQATTAILGDSRLARGLDPEMLENTVNIAQPAEPYFMTYLKLRKLVTANRFKTLIVGFSYYSISANSDFALTRRNLSIEMSRRLYPLASITELRTLRINHQAFLKVVYRNMCIYPKAKHQAYLGSFKGVQHRYRNDGQKVVRDFFYRDEKVVGISKLATNSLNSMIKIANKNGIRIILVSAPVHRSYLDLVPADFKVEFERYKTELLRKNKNIEIWDYSDHLKDTDNYFGSHHLNRKGATLFTTLIRARLEKSNEGAKKKRMDLPPA